MQANNQGGVSEYEILTHRPGDMIWGHRQRGDAADVSDYFLTTLIASWQSATTM